MFQRPWNLNVVWAVLPFVFVVGGMALLPSRSWDMWWHLFFGRVADATGEMWMTNGVLYTLPEGAQSYVQPWLAQRLLYRVFDGFGLNGLVVLRTVLAGGVTLVLTAWAMKRSREAMVAALSVCAIVPFIFFVVTIRSHLFVWPLFVFLLWVAYGVRERRFPVLSLLLFPLAAALWVNLHGSFIVPVLIAVAFFAGSIADRFLGGRTFHRDLTVGFGIATVASFGATFANPQGGDVYGYLSALSSNEEITTTISEWAPTLPWSPVGYGAIFWGLTLGTLFFMFRRRSKIDPVDLFLLLGFALVAARYSRGLMWFCFVFPIVASPYLPSLKGGESESEESSPLLLGVSVALVIGVLLLLPVSSSHQQMLAGNQIQPVSSEPEYLGLVPSSTPVAAARLIKARGGEDRIFHDHRHAGYLLFHLRDEPTPLVFVDHRVELPSSELWRRFYEMSAGNQTETLDEYDVRWVIATKDAQQGLIDALEKKSEWENVLETEHDVTFQRR